MLESPLVKGSGPVTKIVVHSVNKDGIPIAEEANKETVDRFNAVLAEDPRPLRPKEMIGVAIECFASAVHIQQLSSATIQEHHVPVRMEDMTPGM